MSRTVTLTIEKMNCASCVGRVDRALSAVNGVRDVSVNLATDTATVIGDMTAAALIRASGDAGYPAAQSGSDTTARDTRRDEEARRLHQKMLIAACLTAPVFVLAMDAVLASALIIKQALLSVASRLLPLGLCRS